MLPTNGTFRYQDLWNQLGAESPARNARSDLEDRAEVTLRLLYEHVASELAGDFGEYRRKAQEQLRVLARLAEVDELTVPAAVEAEIHDIAGRYAWLPTAQSAVLPLFESARSVAVSFAQAVPMSVQDWADIALDQLSRDEFTEDTGLEGSDIVLAVRCAAESIQAWPELDTHMPILFDDEFLTIGATSEGIVVADEMPLLIIPREGSYAEPEPLFGDRRPRSGTRQLESAYQVTWVDDDRVERALQLVAREGQFVPGTAGVANDDPEQIRWDPNTVEVRLVGSSLLFQPKVRDDGFILKGPEGAARVTVGEYGSFHF